MRIVYIKFRKFAYEKTLSEIKEYAEVLGIYADSEPELLWLAREGLITPLPDCWKPWFVKP